MRRTPPIASRIFRALLLVAPLDFRREYGDAMWRDLTDTIAEREKLRGPFAWLWFVLRACGDIVATGLRERFAMIVRDIAFTLRSLRRTPVALFLSGLGAGLVRSQLFGVGTLDPLTYAIVVIVVSVAALLAALIPALRATRVDPIVALRQL